MRVVRAVAPLRAALSSLRGHDRIGLVPTMGALHAGHGALFARARQDCDHVVASIFVNPTQFDDAADLAAYPRQEAEDVELAQRAGVDTLFVPAVGDVFRPGHATTVRAGGAALGLEADHRPGHFDGVATVCVKLFGMVRPHVAYFGQKDAQQVAVVRQVVRDLDLAIDVLVVPTVRDADGLALSSRNSRLTAAERAQALSVPAALRKGLAAHRAGSDAARAARAALEADGLVADYVAVAGLAEGPTLVVAVRVGTTRLIDNVPLDRPDLAGLSTGMPSRRRPS